MLERYLHIDGFLQVPISGGKYRIDTNGILLDKNNNKIQQYLNSNDELVVSINLWDRYQEYKIALIVAITFKKIHVPYHRWHQLDILHIDNNKNNVHPGNLVWKFPLGGLLHTTLDGFAYIPGYSKYVISKEGKILHAHSGKEINFFFEENYAKCRLLPDIGNVTTTGRHRLICLAWLEYPSNVDVLVVNHINGVPGDDWVSNLEWCTRKENNQHAWKNGLTKIDSTIQMRNVSTGEIKEFSGYLDCARYLNLNKDTVKYRVKSKNQPVYNGFLQFKLRAKKEPWREVEVIKDRPLNVGVPSPIKARNIFTSEVTSYTNVAECARQLNIPTMCVHTALGNKLLPRPYKGFDFKLESDNSEWTNYSENELKVYKEIPMGRPVSAIITDTTTNTEQVFLQYKQLPKFFRIAAAKIQKQLKETNLVKNRYLVKRL